jgi:hypothetical protein
VEALPENSIDEYVDAGLDQADRFNALMEKNNILLHQVFVQNEKGAELLSKWRDSLIMIPTLDADTSPIGAGLNEGEKRFIRNIITSIKSVESSL